MFLWPQWDNGALVVKFGIAGFSVVRISEAGTIVFERLSLLCFTRGVVHSSIIVKPRARSRMAVSSLVRQRCVIWIVRFGISRKFS